MEKTLIEAPQKFKEFSGVPVKQMPLLVAEGRTPLSVAGLMQGRLTGDYDPFREGLTTGDAFAYHPDGRVKIALDSQILRGVNDGSKIIHRGSWDDLPALFIGEDVYNALEGEEFKKEEVKKLERLSSSIEDAKSHPVWRSLTRDQRLLDEYVGYVFSRIYTNHTFLYESKSKEVMGIDLRPISRYETPVIKPICIRRNTLESSSEIFGGNVCSSGRLVGIAPETHGDKAIK